MTSFTNPRKRRKKNGFISEFLYLEQTYKKNR